ncbi:hypothetical protein AAG906_024126 [Vitis piasezkii]
MVSSGVVPWQGPSPHDRSLKRSASEIGLSSSGRLREESTSNTSSNSTATPGVDMGEISSMLAGPSSAAGTGEILERILRQRTNPSNQEDLVPTAPEQRGQPLGGSNTLAQSGGIPQGNDPCIRSRLIAEVFNAMGLQGSGGTVLYQSHTRFSGYWRLLDVVYLPDENEDDEDDDMHLDIDNMVKVIMARLKQSKYTCLATGPWVGEETCCICQAGVNILYFGLHLIYLFYYLSFNCLFVIFCFETYCRRSMQMMMMSESLIVSMSTMLPASGNGWRRRTRAPFARRQPWLPESPILTRNSSWQGAAATSSLIVYSETVLRLALSCLKLSEFFINDIIAEHQQGCMTCSNSDARIALRSSLSCGIHCSQPGLKISVSSNYC